METMLDVRRSPRLVIPLLVAALLVPVVAPRPAAAQDLDEEERNKLFARVVPSVAFVFAPVSAQIRIPVTMLADGRPLEGSVLAGGYGSGWLISPDGYLLTNGHVVRQYQEDQASLERLPLAQFLATDGQAHVHEVARRTGKDPDQVLAEMVVAYPELPATQIRIEKKLQVLLQNGRNLTAEVKEYSPPIYPAPGKVQVGDDFQTTGKDVAVLKVPGEDLPTASLANSDDVEVGDKVYVVGYPGVVVGHDYLSPELTSRLNPSITAGQVSSRRTLSQGNPVLQVDAAAHYGNSGGPVFDERGLVVGLLTFGSVREDQTVEGFNFVVPSNTAAEFIRAAGVNLAQESLFDRTWEHALDAYYAGDYRAAVAGFDQALRIMPGLPEAGRLRGVALRRVQNGGDGGIPVAWILMGVLVVGGVGAVGLVRRRRSAKREAPAEPELLQGGEEYLAPRLARGQLFIEEGSARGRQFPVQSEEIRIGRDAARCQIVLDEPTVSREHAAIEVPPRNGGVRIRNLSATNPTFVNGRSVQETVLEDGDRIQIGDVVLTYSTF